MVLFIILGIVILVTLAVLGALFFLLSKEGQKEDEKAVPLTDLEQLKKELSSQVFESSDFKVVDNNLDAVQVFQPQQESLPTQQVPTLAEDVAYKKRAQDLEDELLSISKKADGQSDEARQLIEDLTKENELLKGQKADYEQAQQRLSEIQAEAASLKGENVNLQTQLDTTNAKVQFLETEMAAVKIQMGEEIARANETVEELKREKESIMVAPPKLEIDESARLELEGIKTEQLQINQRYADLEKTHHELLEQNVQLTQKIEQLEYELIKAKAQSSGLERVSFNYKNQLEDFFKKVNAVQVTNDHLAQVKNRLEGMVEEVKNKNEELIKKDQLAQFELEKNRTRLLSIEREYEDLKARVQQQSQQ